MLIVYLQVVTNKDKNKNTSSGESGQIANAQGDNFEQVMSKSSGRRGAIKNMTAGLMAGLGLVNTACSVTASDEKKEKWLTKVTQLGYEMK